MGYSSLSPRPSPQNWPGLCSFLAMGAVRPLVPAALSAEGWEIVFQQTLAFADYQVTRLRWRGQFGGLLPGGFDAKSIAQQAILDFLQKSPGSPQVGSNNGLSSSTRARPVSAPGLERILWEVKRLV